MEALQILSKTEMKMIKEGGDPIGLVGARVMEDVLFLSGNMKICGKWILYMRETVNLPHLQVLELGAVAPVVVPVHILNQHKYFGSVIKFD